MDRQPQGPYPEAAARWLTDGPGREVLDLGCGTGAFAAMLHRDGHRVVALDRDPTKIIRAGARLGTAVVGQAEALPFADCRFDLVTAAQSLHRFAPGLALAEIARVLRPGGRLAVAYKTRDDTVPWVRRLAARLRQDDPTAMTGDFGVAAVDAIEDSVYFRGLERKTFRYWVPIDHAGLQAMVEHRPATARLDPQARERLLADVAELYASCARAPEPLLLPYQTSCWRAEVDHSELKLSDNDDALRISIGF